MSESLINLAALAGCLAVMLTVSMFTRRWRFDPLWMLSSGVAYWIVMGCFVLDWDIRAVLLGSGIGVVGALIVPRVINRALHGGSHAAPNAGSGAQTGVCASSQSPGHRVSSNRDSP